MSSWELSLPWSGRTAPTTVYSADLWCCVFRLMDLPDDIIYVLLKFCDTKTLGRLAQVCRRLTALISRDCVWLSMKCRLTCVFGCSSSDWSVAVTQWYITVIRLPYLSRSFTSDLQYATHFLLSDRSLLDDLFKLKCYCTYLNTWWGCEAAIKCFRSNIATTFINYIHCFHYCCCTAFGFCVTVLNDPVKFC